MATSGEDDGQRLSMLMYLNPELSAYSNVRTLDDARPYLNSNISQLPPLPYGFDAKVYLAAQKDISGLNETIRQSMIAEGVSLDAVIRRGVFVGTILEPLTVSGSGSFQVFSSSTMRFSDCNLRVGDEVRLNRSRGDPLQGTVTSVTPTGFTLTNPAYTFPLASEYTAFGIMIYDSERQARVAFSRNAPSSTVPPPLTADNFPISGFSLDVYQTAYPSTRAYSFSDAYLDYRSRWVRDGDFRIASGGDIYNNSAPYAVTSLSNNTWTATCENIFLTSNVYAGPNVFLGVKYPTPGGAQVVCTNDYFAAGRCNLIVTDDDARLMSSFFVNGTVGLGMPEPLPGSGTRLAVNGDVFCTGTMVTQSDARVKTDVRRIDDALERVRQLRGYTYNLIADGCTRRHAGLLAHEVESVLPEAVYRTGPGDLASVAYGNVVSVLVEAVNTLADRLDELRKVERKV